MTPSQGVGDTSWCSPADKTSLYGLMCEELRGTNKASGAGKPSGGWGGVPAGEVLLRLDSQGRWALVRLMVGSEGRGVKGLLLDRKVGSQLGGSCAQL